MAPQAKVAFFTAAYDAQHAIELLGQCPDALFRKPIDIEALLKWMRQGWALRYTITDSPQETQDVGTDAAGDAGTACGSGDDAMGGTTVHRPAGIVVLREDPDARPALPPIVAQHGQQMLRAGPGVPTAIFRLSIEWPVGSRNDVHLAIIWQLTQN